MADDTQSSDNYRATIEKCLAEGYAPFRGATTGSRGSAVREAARRLNIPNSTLVGWTLRQEFNGTSPNWSITERSSTPPFTAPFIPPEGHGKTTEPSDPIEVRRLRDELASAKGALKDAERRCAAAEDVRSGLGLSSPILPHTIKSKAINTHGRQSVVLHVSDLHAGEVIRSQEILGSNKYDLATFRLRSDRLFSSAAKLCADHWPRNDKPPEEVIICLGGDLISGSIHPELAETNEGTDYQIFREVAERVAGGIEHIRDTTGLPIRVYSVPGNHGRQTLKPQSKRQGLQSWDILVADFAEAALRHDDQIKWFRSEGTDCYFDVLGFPILLTHGHAMGAGAGQGFVGPAGSIVRGHQKVCHTEFRQRRPVYLVLSAHHHTTVKTPWGWSNGSLVGYNEYVRSFRGEPEPAQQSMFVIHERKGLIRWQPIYVGDPSEGSLYQGFGEFHSPLMEEDPDVRPERTPTPLPRKMAKAA